MRITSNPKFRPSNLWTLRSPTSLPFPEPSPEIADMPLKEYNFALRSGRDKADVDAQRVPTILNEARPATDLHKANTVEKLQAEQAQAPKKGHGAKNIPWYEVWERTEATRLASVVNLSVSLHSFSSPVFPSMYFRSSQAIPMFRTISSCSHGLCKRQKVASPLHCGKRSKIHFRKGLSTLFHQCFRVLLTPRVHVFP